MSVKDLGLLGSINGGRLVWKLSNGSITGSKRFGVEASLSSKSSVNYVYVNFTFQKRLWVAPRVGKTVRLCFSRRGRKPMHVRLVMVRVEADQFVMRCKINPGGVPYRIKPLSGLVPTKSVGKIRRRKNRKFIRDAGPWERRWGMC